MEIIKKEEAENLPMYSKGREGATSAWIKTLAVGEMLKISKADWNRKKPPYGIANHIAKKTGRTFKCGKLQGFDGWVIRRVT